MENLQDEQQIRDGETPGKKDHSKLFLTVGQVQISILSQALTLLFATLALAAATDEAAPPDLEDGKTSTYQVRTLIPQRNYGTFSELRADSDVDLEFGDDALDGDNLDDELGDLDRSED